MSRTSRVKPRTADRADSGRDDTLLLPVRRDLGASILVAWTALFFVGVVWYILNDQGFWLMAGALACLVVSLPLAVGRRQYDIVSPWSLILLAAYIGYGVRGLYISLGVNGTHSLDDLYFIGHPTGYFYRPTAIFMLALGLLTFAYIAGGRQRPGRPIFGSRPHLNADRVSLAVLASAALGFIGFYLFARHTGGLSLSRISAKRTTINGVQLDTSYQSFGQFRVLAGFSSIAFWLQLAYYAYRDMPHGVLTRRGWWLGVLFVNAALLPAYASTRSDVVYIVISAVLIELCLRGRRFRVSALVAAALVAIVAAMALSSIRGSETRTQGGQVTVSKSVFLDTFILTRTFTDIPATGLIINAVPSQLPYANGSTIEAWLAAPIPRSVWPTKPLISPGPLIGQAIYGNQRSGVPPGMIAEAYWNFGWIGILVIPLLCGFFIRRIGDYWAPFARTSPEAALLLSVAAVRPGVDLMINATGSAVYNLLQTLVVLVPVLAFVGSVKPNQPTQERRKPDVIHMRRPRDEAGRRARSHLVKN